MHFAKWRKTKLFPYQNFLFLFTANCEISRLKTLFQHFSRQLSEPSAKRRQTRGDFLEVNKNVHREFNGRLSAMKLSIQKQQRLCNFYICCFHNFSSFKHGAGNFYILHKYLRLEIFHVKLFLNILIRWNQFPLPQTSIGKQTEQVFT